MSENAEKCKRGAKIDAKINSKCLQNLAKDLNLNIRSLPHLLLDLLVGLVVRRGGQKGSPLQRQVIRDKRRGYLGLPILRLLFRLVVFVILLFLGLLGLLLHLLHLLGFLLFLLTILLLTFLLLGLDVLDSTFVQLLLVLQRDLIRLEKR